VRGSDPPEHGGLMVNPIPAYLHLSPGQLEHLEELADASRLRAARAPSHDDLVVCCGRGLVCCHEVT
jgi:hypothetical protein